MVEGKPSRTAWAAAAHRAAHQVAEAGRIFPDPLALRILGADPARLAEEAGQRPGRRAMRIFIAVRHRFAEDALALAIDRGLPQIVILGAGLDTWAYRAPVAGRVRVFEVDHPATQAWKRELLAAANIASPATLTFAPVDFERQLLEDGLAAAGFKPELETFFVWLGVVPYLTEDAIWRTLSFIGKLLHGAHVVFDYADPPDTLSDAARAAHEKRAARVSESGEPFLSYFDRDSLRGKLNVLGFHEIDDLGPRQIFARYLGLPAEAAPERGGHIIRASTTPLSPMK